MPGLKGRYNRERSGVTYVKANWYLPKEDPIAKHWSWDMIEDLDLQMYMYSSGDVPEIDEPTSLAWIKAMREDVLRHNPNMKTKAPYRPITREFMLKGKKESDNFKYPRGLFRDNWEMPKI